MFGILLSFWDGLFSGAMLVLGSVSIYFDVPQIKKKNIKLINVVQDHGFFLEPPNELLYPI